MVESWQITEYILYLLRSAGYSAKQTFLSVTPNNI